ncbi:MAG: tetratricopeptide repeat protein, partial [FCB group bacterium]|nr:tetratricopeptide repeat protein [FCB group bacterium]
YLKAHALDSANQIINFNIALNCLYRNRKDSAKTILLNNLDYNKGAQAQGETRIYLANLLKDSPDKAQQKKATQYYQEAISMFKQALQINGSSASAYMWIGIAYLGLDDMDNAINYLHTAAFIETRPFYLGMINFWLGKAYEKTGEKKKAREFFGKVLSLPSADYHQREAKLFLKNQNAKK